ncbi:MAG: hypothetical protein AB1782_14600 [Cyanobacteriota bacterium]
MKKLAVLLAAAMLILTIGSTYVFAQDDEVDMDNIHAPLVDPGGDSLDQPLPDPEEEDIREEQEDEQGDVDWDSPLPPPDSLDF